GNDPVTNVEVTYYSDGNAGPLPEYPDNYNRTGYTLRKYINQEDNMKGSCRAKTFAVFRYAEILLNYVEALNELEGSYTDEATGITVTRNTEE
ncbi:UNVERIFIED_CONTAM: RagB/SusD family nutrient uptake outer membrane protein, partial [Bacteroidetes bacterium 56_B9]